MPCCGTCPDSGSTSSLMDWGQHGFKIRQDDSFMMPATSMFAGWKTGYGPECGCGRSCGGGCGGKCGGGCRIAPTGSELWQATSNDDARAQEEDPVTSPPQNTMILRDVTNVIPEWNADAAAQFIASPGDRSDPPGNGYNSVGTTTKCCRPLGAKVTYKSVTPGTNSYGDPRVEANIQVEFAFEWIDYQSEELCSIEWWEATNPSTDGPGGYDGGFHRGRWNPSHTNTRHGRGEVDQHNRSQKADIRDINRGLYEPQSPPTLTATDSPYGYRSTIGSELDIYVVMRSACGICCVSMKYTYQEKTIDVVTANRGCKKCPQIGPKKEHQGWPAPPVKPPFAFAWEPLKPGSSTE